MTTTQTAAILALADIEFDSAKVVIKGGVARSDYYDAQETLRRSIPTMVSIIRQQQAELEAVRAMLVYAGYCKCAHCGRWSHENLVHWHDCAAIKQLAGEG